MELVGKDIAVTKEDLTRSDDGEAVMTSSNYDQLIYRDKVTVLRSGKGLGNYALILYSSLPSRFKARFERKYSNPEQLLKEDTERLVINEEARNYYRSVKLPNGEWLPTEKVEEYAVNASALEVMQGTYLQQKQGRHALNNPGTPIAWTEICAYIESMREKWGHTLPANPIRLRDKLRQYMNGGYDVLVSKKFCNANTLKITPEAQEQIIALQRCRVPVYNTQQLFDKFNEIAQVKGWKRLKSKNSLVSFLNRPEIMIQWYAARYGETARRQKFGRRNRTWLPTRRDELWYGDGTKINLYYKSYESGKWVMRTTSVYEVIDAYSESFLGYSICKNENNYAQYTAYRMAVEYARHKPYELVYDNQGGHKKLADSGFFKRISFAAHPTMPYNGPSKTIESIFGRFQAQVLARDWRFTGQNITAKSQRSKINLEFVEANADKLFTYEELMKEYAKARKEWNSLRHPATDRPRIEMYDSSVNEETVRVNELDMIDLFWCITDEPSTFTPDGIEIQVDKRKYAYEVFDGSMPDLEFRRRNTYRKFFVQYDPQDMTKVRLMTKDTSNKYRFVATALPYRTVHRGMQSQSEGERSFLMAQDEANKLQRVQMQIEEYELDTKYGVAPEQHGLRTPKLKGIKDKEYERLSEQVLKASLLIVGNDEITENTEETELGKSTKKISNMTPDMAFYNRM